MADFKFQTSDFSDKRTLFQTFNAYTQNRDPNDGSLKPLKTTLATDPQPQKAITTFNMSQIMQGSAIVKPAVAPYDAYNQALSSSLSQILATEQGKPSQSLGNQTTLVPNDILQQAGVLAAQNAATSTANGQQGAGAAANPGAANGKAGIAVAEGLKQVGKPYVWGAVGPDSFDCSGLVQWCWKAAGIDLPHYSGTQYDVTTHLNGPEELQPGDLVFYQSPAEHVTMYIGNNQVVNAPHSNAQVRIDDINYWATTKFYSRVPGGNDVVPDGSPGTVKRN
jgi:cell wall-associated NlpC family hydrolase